MLRIFFPIKCSAGLAHNLLFKRNIASEFDTFFEVPGGQCWCHNALYVGKHVTEMQWKWNGNGTGTERER